MCLDKCSACAQYAVGLRCPEPGGSAVIKTDVSHHFMSPSMRRNAAFITFVVLRIYFHNFHQKPQEPTLEDDTCFSTFEINAHIFWLIWHIRFVLSLFHLTVRHKRDRLFIYLTPDLLPEGEIIPQSSSLNYDKETYLSWKFPLTLSCICPFYAA